MKKILIYALLLVSVLAGCIPSEPTAQRQIPSLPAIYPDYTDVTIPANIAPLRFRLKGDYAETVAVLSCGEEKVVTEGTDGKFLFPEKDWQRLTSVARGKDIEVKVYAGDGKEWSVFKSFYMHVANDDIDPWLAYRLLPPGYELWFRMGIYQRNLTNYDESAILQNELTEHNCMNCHSFRMQDSKEMVFHMRQALGGTYLVKDGVVEKINGKISDEIPSLVYPYWHPSGRFVAFSTNNTHQVFHMQDKNRIEVYDESSDVLVYDLEKHEALVDSLLFSKSSFETFPAFSPDGKSLFFCSAPALAMPEKFDSLKYSLCSIAFDENTRRFGTTVDTLYNARIEGRSAKFPRVSPDGRYLIFTLSDYGNFSIWHHDADLFCIDLKSGATVPLTAANSDDTESYHSWSHNSRWLVFSSRRDDGLYTRPYFTYIDKSGKAHKPFILPQADPNFYDGFMYSYNIPELIQSEVKVNAHDIIKVARKE